MYKIKEGDPAPYDGFIINREEYIKILNNEKLLIWVNKKLDKVLEKE